MSRALAGWRVLVTRVRAQATELIAGLEALGAEVAVLPMIRIAEPSDDVPLRRAVGALSEVDWLVFTSPNGVEFFWRALRGAGLDTPVLEGVSICAIGPATAAAVRASGADLDVVAEEHVGEGVVDALVARGPLRGKRILLPRAEVARPMLPEALRGLGAEVVDVPAYRTLPDDTSAGEARRRIAAGEVDLVIFTAGSTVRNFVEMVGTEIGQARVACIGPVTARTARSVGLPVHVQAEEYTIPGLLAALVRTLGGERG